MLKFWMEEFKPGYFIKYDGFRAQRKYTYIAPDTSRDVDTYEQAYALAQKDRAVYDVEVDLKLPYPFHGPGSKFTLEQYGGQMVCAMIEWSDGKVLIETGGEDSRLEIVDKKELKC